MSAPARSKPTYYLKSENPTTITFTGLTFDYDEYKIVLKSSNVNDVEVAELAFTRTDNVFAFDPTSEELDKFTQNSRLEFQFITTGNSKPYVPLVLEPQLIDAFRGTADANTSTFTIDNDITVTVDTTKGIKGDTGDTGPKGDTGDFSDSENLNNLGSVSGAITIDFDLGTVIKATLTGAITSISFSNLPSAGQVYAFTLEFTNVESITWPAGTLFANSEAPSPSGTVYQIPCSIDSAGTLTVYGVINNIGTV